MKTLFKTIFLLTIIFGGSSVSAQTPTPTAPLSGEYTVLAPLPGTTKVANCTGTNCTADINSYLGGFLNLVIGIGAVIAMIMIGFYGFQYALSDSASVKMADSAKLWEIVQGLLLIISAYAIIYTINPALLTFSLEITTPRVTAPAVTTTGTNPDGTTASTGPGSEVAVRTALSGIGINAGPCAPNQTRGCTNVAGLPQIAIDGLLALTKSSTGGCGCGLTITGGTEGGHATHGPGRAIVDLNPTSALNSYLGRPNPRERDTATKVIAGRTLVFVYEEKGGNASGTSTGNHWHVVIN